MLKKNHKYQGLLIVIEGTDGSGKSTQIELLKRYVEDLSYGTLISEWKTSTLIAQAIDEAKDRNLLNATTFSLLYAADFADRLEILILHMLVMSFEGMIMNGLKNYMIMHQNPMLFFILIYRLKLY